MNKKLRKLLRDPNAFFSDAIAKRADQLPEKLKSTGIGQRLPKLPEKTTIERARKRYLQTLLKGHNHRNRAIYLDVTRTMLRKGGHHTGITRVEFAYITSLVHQDRFPVYFVTQRPGPHLKVVSLETLAAHLVHLDWISDAEQLLGSTLNPECRVFARMLELRQDDIWDAYLAGMAPPGVFLHTSHAGLEKHAVFTHLKNCGGFRQVFYVHDLIPIDYPEFVDIKTVEPHRQRMFSVAAHADLVLTNSEYTSNRLLSFLRDHRLRLPPVRELLIGVEDAVLNSRGALQPLRVPSDFVYVSTIEPRKNHIFLLDLWRWMIERDGNNAPRLTIVGKRGWNNENVFQTLDNSATVRPFVRELNSVDDASLIKLYQQSTALLFPSHVEGWGMPVVEAQTLGVPAIISTAPALCEASQGMAVAVDLVDGQKWVEQIRLLMQPRHREAQHRRLIQTFEPPTWSTHIATLFELVEELMGLPAEVSRA